MLNVTPNISLHKPFLVTRNNLIQRLCLAAGLSKEEAGVFRGQLTKLYDNQGLQGLGLFWLIVAGQPLPLDRNRILASLYKSGHTVGLDTYTAYLNEFLRYGLLIEKDNKISCPILEVGSEKLSPLGAA